MLGFIDEDGYTEDGYIAEVPRLHPAVRFRYRPMTSGERAQAMREMEKAVKSPNAKMGEIVSARLMSERISEWDLKNAAGEIVPITAENMLKVKPHLSNKLYAITITAVVGSDEDPESPEKSKGNAGNQEEGLSPEEADIKN